MRFKDFWLLTAAQAFICTAIGVIFDLLPNDLLRIVAIGPVAGVYTLIGSFYIGRRERGWLRERGVKLAAFAQQRGLEYSFSASSVRLPPRLKKQTSYYRNVIPLQWQGVPISYADYSVAGEWYATRLSVVAADIGITAPRVEVSKKRRLSARLTWRRSVSFGSLSFRRAFRVRSQDDQFARELFDDPMMGWLLSTGTRFRFEVEGNSLYVTCKCVEPEDLLSLFDAAAGFVAHIPRAVLDGWPRGLLVPGRRRNALLRRVLGD